MSSEFNVDYYSVTFLNYIISAFFNIYLKDKEFDKISTGERSHNYCMSNIGNCSKKNNALTKQVKPNTKAHKTLTKNTFFPLLQRRRTF